MEKSFFFNAALVDGSPDRIYSASDIAQREALLISDGVLGADSLSVIALSADSIYVDLGGAMISGYTYLNTGLLSLPVAEGDASFARIDTVALKLDLSARTITATVIQGTPANIPMPPRLTDTGTEKYLPLADIYVAAGSLGTSQANVTDRRVLAGFVSMTKDMKMLLREYIGETAVMSADEVAALRLLLDTVKTDGDGDTVLCDDGVYRSVTATSPVVAAEFTEPGDYTFEPSLYPSENGLYMIEVQGAGGGGGAYSGTDHRGGGGGGGGYATISSLPLRRASYKITVGEGGAGVPGGSGCDGTSSSFDGIIAEGGHGGGGGLLLHGGEGGAGMIRGGDGADGRASSDGTVTSSSGKGGASQYGDGALSPVGEGEAEGVSATYPGEGGSGASSLAGTFGKAGGRGGDGRVTVYRYVTGGDA